jgi:hypothetical protein
MKISEELGGKPTWHSHKLVQSLVVNVTVGSVRNINCVSTCRWLIVDLSQNKLFPRRMDHNQLAGKINLIDQKKIEPTFLFSSLSIPLRVCRGISGITTRASLCQILVPNRGPGGKCELS